ncbi:MAG: hypothetical protein HY019_04030 [Aquabacterium sp.]|uniref:Imm72 family immunity protein n=1 Tax=Aquabacterium sp. TaxID=1872578 RepID=UPI0025BEEEF0|nr:Imm72 family immunity protein [Aquabacterium sp.]MBI3381155.1 hypothetical protein [Aquabacterium sp.]
MKFIPTLFGGTKPPLRPNGPASFVQPDDGERQALFWWLKRNTSYTAIADNARLWSEFAQDFEGWLRSQDSPYESDIQTYKYIADDQVNYERGLAALRSGDRSVFSQTSSEGWLNKVNTGLVQRRYEWWGKADEIARVQGWPLQLVERYYRAHDAAMASGHGVSYYALRQSRPGIRGFLAQLRQQGLNTSLPEPLWDVYFSQGKHAPKDGIYEQVDCNGRIVGGMEYFIKGQVPVMNASPEFGPLAATQQTMQTSSIFWRLLWEDTRYRDGSVPAEEVLYRLPVDDVEADQAGVAASPSARLRCPAGQPCPRTGWWFTPAAEAQRHFEQGEIMPRVESDYGETIWSLDLPQ